MTIQQFEDLKVWQLSKILVSNIYTITKQQNFKHDFDLVSQIRRAATSIMLNISEGFERKSTKDFINFLNFSKGSCGEVRAILYIALEQKYISQEEFNSLYNECIIISKSLSGFMQYLNSKKS